MYAPERHRIIVEQARAAGRVDVKSLAASLAVTPETIRRDLTALEEQDILRRVHGGAIPTELLGFGQEPDLTLRTSAAVEEKQRIAHAALDLLPTHGSILVDAGSSTALLAALIATRPELDLTIVTHSLPIAASLAAHPGIQLHQIGGQVRDVTQAAVGPWTLATLAQIRVDVAFLGTNGITPHGITTPDVSEAAVKTALIGAAHRTVLLADHTKFGRQDFAHVAPVEALDTIVTDSGLPEATLAEYAELGPEMIRA